MGAIMPRLVPRVYTSYKGKILPLLLYFLFYVYIFLVLFIDTVIKNIFNAHEIKKN